MEVHAHSHTERKKWYHYLWEFLMLFLAVFCGFLAENIREHLVDKTKEKEYIKLIVKDLQTDDSVLLRSIGPMKQTIKGLDTLIKQTYLAVESKADTKIMYYAYHHYCRTVFNLEFAESSILQLQNSGNLRLIHDPQIATIISQIAASFESLKEKTAFYKLRQEDPSSFGMKIFDFKEYQKANINTDGSLNINDDGFLHLSYPPVLNYTDPLYLKEFAARTGYYRNSFSSYVKDLESGIPKVEAVIRLLKEKYDLE